MPATVTHDHEVPIMVLPSSADQRAAETDVTHKCDDRAGEGAAAEVSEAR